MVSCRFSAVRTKLKHFDAGIISSTEPLATNTLLRLDTNSFHPIVWYTMKPSISAYRTATAAASVVVTAPMYMPPSRMTGVSSGSRQEMKEWSKCVK